MRTPATPAADASYVVQPGDSLAAIARRFDVPLGRLRQANPCLAPHGLHPGQVLAIPLMPLSLPAVPPVAFPYVTQPDDSPGQPDTLARIAARFAVSQRSLRLANPILAEAGFLAPGTFVFVPTVPQPPAFPPAALQIAGPGDSLAGIGRRFGVPLIAMLEANPHVTRPDRLIPGGIVAVPAPGTETDLALEVLTYVVQPGDTLESIALQWEVDRVWLAHLNPLPALAPGLILRIPPAAALGAALDTRATRDPPGPLLAAERLPLWRPERSLTAYAVTARAVGFRPGCPSGHPFCVVGHAVLVRIDAGQADAARAAGRCAAGR